MTGFLDTVWPDIAISVDEIASIGPELKRPEGAVKERPFRMRDGTTRVLSTYDAERVLRRPIQLIDAAPETFTVTLWICADEKGLNKSPVIAWALCADGEVRPVTVQGVNDGGSRDGETYVLMPNGTVQGVGEHADPVWFDTLREFVEHETDRVQRVLAEDAQR